MSLIARYKKAFSLRDEIGHCPNLKADLKVIDDSAFFVRPFPISEPDKPFMDRQMERLISLGILSRNSTSHTSPVMLIMRKLTKGQKTGCRFQTSEHSHPEAQHIHPSNDRCLKHPW